MSLRGRLDALRRESGSVVEHDRLAPSAALRERLERIDRHRSSPPVQRQPGRPTRREIPIEKLALALDARILSDHLLCVERLVPLSSHHGAQTLETLADHRHGDLPGWPAGETERLVFVDTETSGLAGGAGTIAFMTGLAFVDGEMLRIRQYLLTGFSGEPAMFRALSDDVADADVVVTYNGKSFDAPLLAGRACMSRQASPLCALRHLDLLYPVRSLYADRWPDCRLGTVENRLLGFTRVGDLPGSEAPRAWFDFVHRGDWEGLPGVLHHNRRDLLSLAALVPMLARAYHRPSNFGADPRGAARVWCRYGDEGRARSLLNEAERGLDTRGRLELARLERRAGRLEVAVGHWRALAKQGDARAIEHLAKYYEHVERDWRAALSYALALDPASAAARCRRLRAKLRRAHPQVELEF